MDSKVVDSKHVEHVELVTTPSYDTLPVYKEVTAEEPHLPTYSAPIASTSVEALLVPTAGPSLSSGFAYDPSLSEFNIGAAEWAIFTQELQRAAAVTLCQKTLAVLSGVATVAVIIDPWTSSCVARYVWNKQVERNVVRGLKQNGKDDCCCKPKETVGTIMKRWNGKWNESGVAVSLEVGKASDKADEEGMKEEASDELEQHGCKPRKCHSTERSCRVRGSCALRRAYRHKANCRRTCEKRVASFRLVVRRTEKEVVEKSHNELSEKTNE